MMLERNNQGMNIGWIQFIKLVLDLFQMFALHEFHSAITTIIEQCVTKDVLLTLSEIVEAWDQPPLQSTF